MFDNMFKKKLISHEEISGIVGQFFVTGTRAYGPVSSSSDLDIVMAKTDAMRFLEAIKKHNYMYTQNDDYEETSSFTCVLSYDLPPVNVIVADGPAEWYMWEYATNKMKELPPVIDREKRIALFNHFQAAGLDTYLKAESTEWFKRRAAAKGKVLPKTVTVQNTGFTGFVDEDVNPPVDYDDDIPF